MHSLRVQTDRKRYHMVMKHLLEQTPNLYIHQAEITGVDIADGKVRGVFTNLDGYYGAKCVVIATGTSLGGRIFVGSAHYDGGPRACPCAGSRPVHRPGCTGAALRLTGFSASPVTRTTSCSPSAF